MGLTMSIQYDIYSAQGIGRGSADPFYVSDCVVKNARHFFN